MKSIRSYLLSRLLGGSVVVLVTAGVVVYVAVVRSLEAQFDANLTDRVQAFASALFQDGYELSFEFSDELMPEYDPELVLEVEGLLPAYFQLWLSDGRLIERSNTLGETDLDVPLQPTEEPSHWTAPLPDGRVGRYVAQFVRVHHVYPEEGPDAPPGAKVLIAIAGGREELVLAERNVLVGCFVVSFALMGLIGALSWRAVRRGLEPATRLAAALDAIRVEELPEGLDVGDLPLELQPVADKTDALIRRVDTALERERRTTADIAHELRTPISELLTVSEVALRDSRDHEGQNKALRTLRDVAWRMGRAVSTLLKLARLEMGAEAFDKEGVDLGAIVREHLRSLVTVERERGLQVDNDVACGDLVEGDRDVVHIVVSNLLSNALHYSPAQGTVACRLERSESGWRFWVENESAELAPDDLRTLSEPFWRKDRARADRDRSGLGLALSRSLAEKTGMELDFELEDRTFRAILSRSASGNGDASHVVAAP